tara:strand:+ start:1433 stop:1789 length:357 start_codon:yes stop_codon:yes gene_type:complete
MYNKKELRPIQAVHGGPSNNPFGKGINSTQEPILSKLSGNAPNLMKDIESIKKQVDENSKDKREYHTFGNPDTLTRAKDNKVINTKDVDEGEFSKVKTMPPLKPIVTGPKDDQYYVND